MKAVLFVFIRDDNIAKLIENIGFALKRPTDVPAWIACKSVLPEWGGAFLALTPVASGPLSKEGAQQESLLVPAHSVLATLHGEETRSIGFSASTPVARQDAPGPLQDD